MSIPWINPDFTSLCSRAAFQGLNRGDTSSIFHITIDKRHDRVNLRRKWLILDHDFGGTSVHGSRIIDYLHHGRAAVGAWGPWIGISFKAHSHLVIYFHQPSSREGEFKEPGEDILDWIATVELVCGKVWLGRGVERISSLPSIQGRFGRASSRAWWGPWRFPQTLTKRKMAP